MKTMGDPDGGHEPKLRRSLGLGLLILYGLGVTIGAGIYVLIGVTAGQAGLYAPVSFGVAALVMVFSAASFAEFSSRFPVSAGEAAYVRAGFQSDLAALAVGLTVIVSAVIAAATISLGSIGYIREFVHISPPVLIGIVVVAMGAIAGAGTLQSVMFAGILTLIEIGGLLAVIIAGVGTDPALIGKLVTVFPTDLNWSVWSGIFGAGLLAFFAFIGFEDMINVAEEVKNPRRIMPIAIFTTLGLATLLYFLISAIAVLKVPITTLAASEAPLSLVFDRVAHFPPALISAIAIVATLNGVIIQIIMAARVVYGLANSGQIPAVLGRINPHTRTPVLATLLVTAAVLVLALATDLVALAELSSQTTLIIFAAVNLALVRLKMTARAPAHAYMTVPIWIPIIGATVCVGFAIIGFF